MARQKIFLRRDECILLLRRAITNGTTPYGISVVEEWMEGADNRISALEAALREITELAAANPMTLDWHIPLAQIAEIGRTTLAGDK